MRRFFRLFKVTVALTHNSKNFMFLMVAVVEEKELLENVSSPQLFAPMLKPLLFVNLIYRARQPVFKQNHGPSFRFSK